MGGFHGGHSGGHSGGFHGGHSSHSSHSSSYHSHSSYHSTHVYVSGSSIDSGYGATPSKPMSYKQKLGVGIVLLFVGVFLFLFLFKTATTATVTYTWKAHDYSSTYEAYDFEYYVRGKVYRGYGDDDLDVNGDYTVHEGEKYEIYVSLLSPSIYDFSPSSNVIAVIFLVIFGGIGLITVVTSIQGIKRHQERLREVGDANKDGVVDDRDIEYAEAQAKAQMEGTYLGTKKAESENAYNKHKVYKKCIFCGTTLADDAFVCPNCGSTQN